MTKWTCTSALLLAIQAIGTPTASAVTLDSGIPESQRRSIENDLKFLHQLGIQTENTSEAARVMGIRGPFDTAALEQWLSARVKYVVGEDWQVSKSTARSQRTFQYPNPSILPEIELAPPRPPSGPSGPTPKPMTVMSNSGVGIYLNGKERSIPFDFILSNRTRVPVLSPRVGLIKVGEGLFRPRTPINPNDINAPGNSISRLATFFHEGRHSDGNGKSLGFLHAVCPKGHPMEGSHSCDRNRNGPYTIGGQIGRILLNSCTDCTEKEKEMLRARALDSFGRVIVSYKRDRLPRTTRMTLEAEKALCEANRGAAHPTCRSLAARLDVRTTLETITTRDWNPAPETAR